MKKTSFIILNSISVLIEYLIIYLFFRYVLNKIFIISLIMTLLILILMILFVVYANYTLRKTNMEDKVRPCEEELLKIVKIVEKKYNKKVVLHYVSAPQPNPAWCIGNHVYINNEYRCPDIYLPGVIAHELGHVISGVSNFTFIPSLKVSTILSRVFQLSIMALVSSKKASLKMIAYILFIPYYIINLNNLIFTYHFLKNDEFFANQIACELGYGDYLRCYYGLAVRDGEDPLFRKCDLMHPNIDKMLSRINELLNIRKEYENIYYINNLLVLAYIETKTFTIPSFINELYNNSIISDNIVKIKSNYVSKVYPNAFRQCSNLEIIDLENVKDFSHNSIRNLNKLKVIKIDDLNVIYNIYNHYPNKQFSDKLYKILVKQDMLKEDELNNLQKY